MFIPIKNSFKLFQIATLLLLLPVMGVAVTQFRSDAIEDFHYSQQIVNLSDPCPLDTDLANRKDIDLNKLYEQKALRLYKDGNLENAVQCIELAIIQDHNNQLLEELREAIRNPVDDANGRMAYQKGINYRDEAEEALAKESFKTAASYFKRAPNKTCQSSATNLSTNLKLDVNEDCRPKLEAQK
jgi:tetratricopeptide (TPR) repeat protein